MKIKDIALLALISCSIFQMVQATTFDVNYVGRADRAQVWLNFDNIFVSRSVRVESDAGVVRRDFGPWFRQHIPQEEVVKMTSIKIVYRFHFNPAIQAVYNFDVTRLNIVGDAQEVVKVRVHDKGVCEIELSNGVVVKLHGKRDKNSDKWPRFRAN
jgi:hypothetical protein